MHFLYLFLGSLIAGMIYLHLRFTMNLSRKRGVRLGMFGLLFSVVLGIFAYFWLRIKGVSGLGLDLLAWYVYSGIGVLSFLLSLLVLMDGFLLVRFFVRRVKGRPATPQAKAHRRFFLKQSVVYSLSGGALLLSGKGFYNAHKTPDVKEVIIPVSGLHPDLSGFSLVQITDIHLGPTLKGDFLEKVVKRVNTLSPDVVALTGDLVDGRVSDLGRETLSLTNLNPAYGKYFVTGNHEYYFNGLEWCSHMESLGFTVLNNSHRLIEHNGGRLLLAGVTDLRAESFVPSHRSDPAKAMANAPFAHARVLLAHQPKSVYQAAPAGFDIQISGHTHGGQFLPWPLMVKLAQPFLAGVYHYGDVFLYVSRGTGYWGPPMRMGSPSEITRLILKRT